MLEKCAFRPLETTDGEPRRNCCEKKNGIRPPAGIVALMLIGLLSPAAVRAGEPDGGNAPTVLEGFEISGEATLTSDYRFRGISVSDRDIAVQGAVDLAWDGWHLGWWGSSIQAFAGAEAEVDVTFGRSFSAGAFDLDVGGIAYLFPGGRDVAYLEAYGAVSGALGLIGWMARVHYVPAQSNTGRRDNVYLAGALSLPLVRLDLAGGVPVTLDGGLGYEDGALADGKWDWRLGLAAEMAGLALGIHYVDTNVAGRLSGAGALFSISKAF